MDALLLVIFAVWSLIMYVNGIAIEDPRILIGGWGVILILCIIPLIGYYSPPAVTDTIEIVDSYSNLKFPCFVQIHVRSYDYHFSIFKDRDERTLNMSCVKVNNAPE